MLFSTSSDNIRFTLRRIILGVRRLKEIPGLLCVVFDGGPYKERRWYLRPPFMVILKRPAKNNICTSSVYKDNLSGLNRIMGVNRLLPGLSDSTNASIIFYLLIFVSWLCRMFCFGDEGPIVMSSVWIFRMNDMLYYISRDIFTHHLKEKVTEKILFARRIKKVSPTSHTHAHVLLPCAPLLVRNFVFGTDLRWLWLPAAEQVDCCEQLPAKWMKIKLSDARKSENIERNCNQSNIDCSTARSHLIIESASHTKRSSRMRKEEELRRQDGFLQQAHSSAPFAAPPAEQAIKCSCSAIIWTMESNISVRVAHIRRW